ncbi:MAG TPA: DUF5916 domain-containing protein [Gemmatimonadaceae bacterium]|nr:DUF5916 domain-containing protein [Gemmatimonadaceae bacterium]
MSVVLVLAIAAALQVPAHDSAAPAAVASRARDALHIDGRLDEAAWRDATPITTFAQRDPNAGAPATQPTDIRILYDASAIYIGARLTDSTATPSSRLGRRDSSLSGSDWLYVTFDSYHDHLTAFRFGVNPDGVRRDEKVGGGDDEDESWDPVWEATATRDATGWTAEIRIPLSQLRFREQDEQTWGLQLVRRIGRNNEEDWWAFVPKRERSGVARYGHLAGLRGLAPGGPIELLPYLVTRARFDTPPTNADVSFENPYRDGSEQTASLGLDLKYRVASNMTLDATVNPDFGQVEVDPAVVNLTAFETRFEERRPFFVEGSEIFRFNGAELFYSRRIGAPPPGRPPSFSVYDDMPENATILGAAKLSGKARGWSLAVLDAVTDRERASYVDADRRRGSATVAPLSNYFVGRARRELREGQSVIGGLVTAAHRDLANAGLESRLRSRAFAGGADFSHDWSDRKWSLSGFVAGSRIDGTPAVITAAQRSSARYFQRPDASHIALDSAATSLDGYAARLVLEREAGEHWRGNTSLLATSPGFETNDLGFQSRADQRAANATLEYVHEEPGRVLREWSLEGGPRATWNFDGDRIGTRLNFEGSAELLNYWSSDFEINRELEVLDDRLTRGGPLAMRPAKTFGSVSFESDSRKPWTISGELTRDWGMAGSATGLSVELGFKPAPSWAISVGPGWSRETSKNQFVASVADAAAAATFGRRYVFADLEQKELSVATHVNVTFTPALTLEAFARPFLGSGTFGGLKELARPRAYAFARYADVGTVTREGSEITIDPDGAGPAEAFDVDDETFTTRSLRGSAVLRWEWRPGSTLFFVWQQRREFEDAQGDLRFNRDLRALGRSKPDNVFVVKATWWVNP